MVPLHAVVRMEKLALVGNYPNNRMRRLRTGDLSPRQSAGEVCFGRKEVEKSHRGHMTNTVLVLYPSIRLLIKSTWRPLCALFGKIAEDTVHRRGTLTLEGYSALCMIVIFATLKQVKVVVVSALSMTENKLLVY